jgi:threonine/homoserine/homoserine lactone efflux protein
VPAVTEPLALLGIAGAIAVGAISPGPSFVMVARTAVAVSRSDGLAAALGMGLGGVVFALAALFGLQALLAAVPWIYVALKFAGGAYLAYLGWRIWQGAAATLDDAPHATGSAPRHPARSFALALATQLSNPKAAVVYASVFAALQPRDPSAALIQATPLAIFVVETGWYAIVATILSAPGPRAAYLRHKIRVDRLAGGVMALLGGKLVAGAIE